MVIVFYNLSKAFISGNKAFSFGLIQDFIVGISLTVYLIYIISNKELQEIIISIIAAVYGGLLTLLIVLNFIIGFINYSPNVTFRFAQKSSKAFFAKRLGL